MTDSVALKINGLEGMLADLRALPGAIQARIMKGMVATGASVIRKKALALAPESTGEIAEGHPPAGTLKKAIYQTRLPSLCTPTREVWKVGVRRGKAARSVGKAQRNLDAYYAFWVEYGHYTRVPVKTTKVARAAARAIGTAKWVSPRPFFRPAVEISMAPALSAMRDYLRANLPLATASLRFIKAR